MTSITKNIKHTGIIWYREILRYWRDKPRIVGSVAMPFFFLVIFGSGLSSSIGSMLGNASEIGLDFKKFMFPGIIGMTTLFTSMFSGLSVVRDREYGFLKEILVSPADRVAVAAGKILGGSTVTMLQATLIFIFAPFVGIGLSATMLLKMWGIIFLGAILFTGFGTYVGSRLTSTEGFQMVMNFLIMPMFFMSGAFFPLKNIPTWMSVLVKINPFAYLTDSMRQVIFGSMGLPSQIMENLPEFGLGLSLFGNSVDLWLDLTIVGTLALITGSIAVYSFNHMD